MKPTLLAVPFLAALLIACGGEPAPTNTAAGAAEQSAPVTDSAAAQRVISADSDDGVAAETTDSPEPQDQQIRIAQADAESDEADAATPTAPIRTDWKYAEGQHFQRLNSAQGVSGPPDSIEVTEVFWYGCDACRRFEPLLASWEETLPADVRFVRIPVIWDNPTYKFHARIFYTAEALGVLEQTHWDTFNSIIDRRSLNSEDSVQAFFAEYGVPAEEFQKHFRSFATESKLGKAAQLVRRYRVTSTPTMVVNGKYVATGPEIRSWGMILDVVEELVARERQR